MACQMGFLKETVVPKTMALFVSFLSGVIKIIFLIVFSAIASKLDIYY